MHGNGQAGAIPSLLYCFVHCPACKERQAQQVKVHTSFSMEEFALHLSFCMQGAFTPDYEGIEHANSDTSLLHTPEESRAAEVKMHTACSRK